MKLLSMIFYDLPKLIRIPRIYSFSQDLYFVFSIASLSVLSKGNFVSSLYCVTPLLRWSCCILTFDPAQNAIQGDAPEGSDTFQWQLREEIAWAEIG